MKSKDLLGFDTVGTLGLAIKGCKWRAREVRSTLRAHCYMGCGYGIAGYAAVFLDGASLETVGLHLVGLGMLGLDCGETGN